MSSAVLYLAIVALWAVVLVPMWVRRAHAGERPDARPLDRAEDPSGGPAGAAPGDGHGDRSADRPRPSPRLGPRGRSRGAVIARRRRRTWALSLLVLAAACCGVARLVPYWSALPPAGLLAGHLSLLRVAVGMDAERREAAAVARAAERARARAAREAREAAQAEIIDLMARNRARDVFDQYAHDELRVVGD
ncbi:MAG TPA: hypothetical protein VF069_17105 [Streptosporangiaceae bacterium]